jgi:hypothetical protein
MSNSSNRRFQEVVVAILLLHFVFWMLFKWLQIPDNKTITTVSGQSQPVIQYPVFEGNVVLGNKKITLDDFNKVVDFSINRITNNPQTEKQVEQLVGVKFYELNEKINETEVNFVTEQKLLFDNPELQAVILEIYRENRNLIKDAIIVYKKKKNDKQFMDKVKNYIRENR